LRNPSNFGGNGTLASAFIGAQSAHAGYVANNVSGKHEETWYRTRLRFPSGLWVPSAGSWNWLVEWHTSRTSRFSCALGIVADGTIGQAGTNPRFWMQLTGGPATGSGQGADTDEHLVGPTVPVGRWIDMLFHYIWDGTAAGLAECWVDGQLWFSKPRPTLCVLADNSWDYNAFGVYHYRSPIAVETFVDFDRTVFGPSRTTVGG
jgi:hypothetical protein